VKSPRRMGAAGLAAAAAVGLVAFLGGVFQPSSGDGPLVQTIKTTTGLPFPANRDGSFGIWLPRNPTTTLITIDRVEVVGGRGLTILGVMACLPDPPYVGIGTAYGFPPTGEGAPAGSPGCLLTPLQGLTMPPVGDATPDRQILIGFRLDGESEAGTIDGLLVTYTAGTNTYQCFLPNALHVRLADASPQS
jgi:hypothetical protein